LCLRGEIGIGSEKDGNWLRPDYIQYQKRLITKP
jgi:hypothetical protein